jgi:hypothetical protein
MRFVAQYGRPLVKLQNERAMHLADGRSEVLDESIIAEFSTSGVMQTDIEVAKQSFKFRGLYQEEDQATPANPIYRISVYDTDEQAEQWGWEHEWDDEKVRRHQGMNKKEWIEQALLKAGTYGQIFVQVPEKPVEPPWPTYDEFDGTPEALVDGVEALGFPFERALDYEASKWGQQREPVILALQAAIQRRDEGDVVLD